MATTEETRTSFTFPELHDRVAEAVSPDIKGIWFNNGGTGRKSINEYSTNVMGRFGCVNNACSQKGWGSKEVAIQIWGYRRNGYKAVVYNQRCKQLGVFDLDEDSYVERVAYRVKQWAGVHPGHQHYDKKQGPPHESDL